MVKRYICHVRKENGYDLFEPTEMKSVCYKLLLEFIGNTVKKQNLSHPERIYTGHLIFRYDENNTEYKGDTKNVISVYEIDYSGFGGELKIFKDGKVTDTIYGSGRPIISTSHGVLQPIP